jgi:hypothetical protein
MKGPELASEALALRPGLPVVFASGYAEDGLAHPGAAWLSKPYEQRELAQALAGLTGRGASSAGRSAARARPIVPMRKAGRGGLAAS